MRRCPFSDNFRGGGRLNCNIPASEFRTVMPTPAYNRRYIVRGYFSRRESVLSESIRGFLCNIQDHRDTVCVPEPVAAFDLPWLSQICIKIARLIWNPLGILKMISYLCRKRIENDYRTLTITTTIAGFQLMEL